MLNVLKDHTLYATAPSWDGKWLSRLLRTANVPRHALRIEDTELAHRRAAQEILRAAHVPDEAQEAAIRDILAKAERRDAASGPAAHRALADARRERDLWLDIRRLATETAARLLQ
jgi:hypothetical protein